VVGHGLLMTRPRNQDGFTLPEMLIAMTIALAVSLASFSLIEFTMKRSGDISGRVDATQRGRTAMDTVTRQLRSQVCLPSGTAAMFSRAANTTDNVDATFFVDFSDGGDRSIAPDLHSISYDAANTQLIENDYAGGKNATPAVDLPYNGTPVRRVLLTGVTQIDAATPIFSYYASDGTRLGTGATFAVTGADLKRIALIKVAFHTAAGRGQDTGPNGVDLQDQVFVRSFDPNTASTTSTCA
jgi:prepilin-type N-terminal cleavage/methylation domain-containing protein